MSQSNDERPGRPGGDAGTRPTAPSPPVGGRRIRIPRATVRRRRGGSPQASIHPETRRLSSLALGVNGPAEQGPEQHLFALAREKGESSPTTEADRGAAPAAVGVTSYDVTDLGGLPPYHSASYAAALNQVGQAVGYTWEGAWPGRDAFLWTPGGTGGLAENPQMQGLGNFSGQPASLWYGSQAWGLNNRGQVVGWANGTDLLIDRARACLWHNGELSDLGALSPYGGSVARAINDAGWVVGSSDTEPGTTYTNEHAFIVDVGSRETIDLGVDNSSAFGINAWGHVVGAYFTRDWDQHVLYWDRTNGAWDLHGLVMLGGRASRAAAISNTRQVAGWATGPDGQWQGFACDLNTGWVGHIGGAVESLATAINNKALAVGRYRATPSTLSYRALAWDLESDTVIDLNEALPADSGWTLFEAWGVNDAGQIAGFGAHRIGDIYHQRGYLLTPHRG